MRLSLEGARVTLTVDKLKDVQELPSGGRFFHYETALYFYLGAAPR